MKEISFQKTTNKLQKKLSKKKINEKIQKNSYKI